AGGLLAQLRRRGLAGLVPAARRRPQLAARVPAGPGRGHAGAAAAGCRAVPAGLACRAAGQPAGDPVVEPGRGALVPAGHAAGSALARGGWLGLAAGRSLLRPELAPVRGDGWQPVRPVVAAGGARLGRTAGAGRGVLAAAAAWRPRQATGRAAVAAAAVAG